MAQTAPAPVGEEVVGPAQGIANVLNAIPQFQAANSTYPIIWGRMMPSPDNQIAVLDTGGKPPEIAVAVDYPTVMVIVRGSAATGQYAEVRGVIAAIRDALLGIPSAPDAWPQLTLCSVRGDIQSLGYDNQNRPSFSLNLQLIVSYDESGYRQ